MCKLTIVGRCKYKYRSAFGYFVNCTNVWYLYNRFEVYYVFIVLIVLNILNMLKVCHKLMDFG